MVFPADAKAAIRSLDHDGRIYVESRKRLIEQDKVRVMEKRGGNQDLLPHAFGIRVQTAYPFRREIERLQYAGDSRLQGGFLYVMQLSR